MGKAGLFFYKLTHWEYWPESAVFFVPMFYYLYLSLRARSLCFFNAANPGIKNGGLAMESKKEIDDILPAEHTPVTLFFKPGTDLNIILDAVAVNGLSFPLIVKPDIGMKGMAVAKVGDAEELKAYVSRAKFNFLVQALITYPNEVGIFYYRYPDRSKGSISGIVRKEFLTVTGDGRSTIEGLVVREPRYMLQMDALRVQYGASLDRVPEKGELLNLVPFGNHARGAKFIDAGHLITDKLTDSIDKICQKIPGFYFGRLDIRYDSFEALERGEGLSIIELNGAGADPTHMFDPRHSLFFAWREICRHWCIMYDISIINHRRGATYLSYAEGRQMFRDKEAHTRLLDSF